MENKALFLGVICCLQIGIWSQIVSTEPATVDVPKESIEVKVGDTASLECFGSNPSLSYYIKNRAVWQFKDNAGRVVNLTSSFYPTVLKQKEFEDGVYTIDYRTVPGQNVFLFNVTKKDMDGVTTALTDGFYRADGVANKFESGVYHLDYKSMNDDQFRFRVNISAITHADNGVYTCSLIGEKDGREEVMSKKTVKVIVLNPVEKIKLQIKDVDGAVSMQPIVQGDKPVKVKPGQYEVICTAEGSNPAPIMSLMYNQNQPYIVPEFSNTTENEQIKNKAKFHVMVDFDAKLGEQQTLTCSAKMPNGQYPVKQAGMKLMVSIDKPDIVCANTTVRVGDKQRDMVCNISTEHGLGSLSCNKVSWRLPKFGVQIPTVGNTDMRRYSSEDKNTYEADCFVRDGIMQTRLMIYDVKPVHFSMIYEVMYDKHVVETMLYEIVSAAHIVLPSLLTMVAVVIISRLLSKTL